MDRMRICFIKTGTTAGHGKCVVTGGQALRKPFRQIEASFWMVACFGFCICISTMSLLAQSSASQSTNANQSWQDTSDLSSGGANPTRMSESHVENGNRTVDTRSLQRQNSDGDYEPYQDIQTETVKVDANTVRTVTRTFGRDSDGAKTLLQVTEEEKRTQPGGDSSVSRSTSNPDANGNLQLVQREIESTKKLSANVQETTTTIMLPGIDGGLSPAMMTRERRTQDSNDSDRSQKTTLLPDGNGNWQVSEVKETKTQKQGNDRTKEERVSRPDANGQLSEISRTVSKESGGVGEKRNTEEKYSLNVPGTPQDGSLHLVDRSTTMQTTSSDGQQTTKSQVEKPDPGDPDAGLRVSVVTSDSVRPGPSGAQATQTIQMLDANGNFAVVSVDTSKSSNAQAVQVEIAPASPAKPKQ
jgi:hypothetical protein